MLILKKLLFKHKQKPCNELKDEVKLLYREVARLADLIEDALQKLDELKEIDINVGIEKAQDQENNDEEITIWGT